MISVFESILSVWISFCLIGWFVVVVVVVFGVFFIFVLFEKILCLIFCINVVFKVLLVVWLKLNVFFMISVIMFGSCVMLVKIMKNVILMYRIVNMMIMDLVSFVMCFMLLKIIVLNIVIKMSFNVRWFVLNVFLKVRLIVFDWIELKIILNDKVINIVKSVFIYFLFSFFFM